MPLFHDVQVIQMQVLQEVGNVFKANNKNNRSKSVTPIWCLYCQRCIYFTPFFSVSIDNCEHVFVWWDVANIGPDDSFSQIY